MVSNEQAEEAVETLLKWLGYKINEPSLLETPRRLASWLGEFRAGQDIDSSMTTFEGIQYDEMIVVTDIPFVSLCEHHMLPFTGTVTIGYIPKGKVIGLSKLARIAVWKAKRLQVQERLTRDICDVVSQAVESPDVGVVVSASHSCMVLRGAKAQGSMTITSALDGAFKNNASTRAEFLAIAR